MRTIKYLLLVLCLCCIGCINNIKRDDAVLYLLKKRECSLNKFDKWVLEYPKMEEYINYIINDDIIPTNESNNVQKFHLYLKRKNIQEDRGGPC